MRGSNCKQTNAISPFFGVVAHFRTQTRPQLQVIQSKKDFAKTKKFYILSIDMYISYNIQKQMYISHKRGLKIFSFFVCLTLRRLLFVFKHIPYTCAHIFATVSRQRQISQCTLYGRVHLRPHLCVCLPVNNTSCNFVLVYMQTINL